MGQEFKEFILNGDPWFREEGETSVEIRRCIAKMVVKMSSHGWGLVMPTNLKGGTDSYFFIRDQNAYLPNGQCAVLGLHGVDKLRLIDFDSDMDRYVQKAIQRLTQRPRLHDVSSFHGSTQFTLQDSPFWCSGREAVATRKLFCVLIQVFAAKGWHCFTTIDTSRRLGDKNSMLFKRSDPKMVNVGCIALSGKSHLKIINFPRNEVQTLLETIDKHYIPGMDRNDDPDRGDYYKIYLTGRPWFYQSCYGLHGRWLMLNILGALVGMGWTLEVSLDCSAKHVSTKNEHYAEDVDSWFFCKTEGVYEHHPDLYQGRTSQNQAQRYQGQLYQSQKSQLQVNMGQEYPDKPPVYSNHNLTYPSQVYYPENPPSYQSQDESYSEKCQYYVNMGQSYQKEIYPQKGQGQVWQSQSHDQIWQSQSQDPSLPSQSQSWQCQSQGVIWQSQGASQIYPNIQGKHNGY